MSLQYTFLFMRNFADLSWIWFDVLWDFENKVADLCIVCLMRFLYITLFWVQLFNAVSRETLLVFTELYASSADIYVLLQVKNSKYVFYEGINTYLVKIRIPIMFLSTQF